jgi:hypothetical protein
LPDRLQRERPDIEQGDPAARIGDIRKVESYEKTNPDARRQEA